MLTALDFTVHRKAHIIGFGHVILLSRPDNSLLVATKKTNKNKWNFYAFNDIGTADSYMDCIMSDASPLVVENTYLKGACPVVHHALVNYLKTVTTAQSIEVYKPDKAPAVYNEPCSFLWHGTTLNNLCSILRQGFKLPDNPGGRMFGAGIYFAELATKSLGYTDKTSDMKCLLLCSVYLGRRLKLTSSKEYHQCPDGYHSVHGAGRYRLKHPLYVDEVRFEISPIVSSGEEEAELQHDEYIVYNPAQISVLYCVMLTNN